ncbi:MAG TPA: hypothetical protein VN851_04485, partial [Thermoanaerobaculia bacterium]|nr:hypothetical protein [Thermoanaerobaculia bacterium]
ERWDRLAKGQLSPDEERALRNLAEGSPEAAAAREAFRPLGADFEARVAGAIREQRAREREAGDAQAAPTAREVPAAPSGRVLVFRRRASFVIGSAAALAASLLAFVLLRPGAGALPVYTAQLSGGSRSERGTTAPPTRVFSRGSRFEMVLRPATAVAGDVAVRCLLVAAEAGGLRAAIRPFPACDRAELSPDGSLRVAGTVGEEIAIAPGAWHLWALVGRPGDLPADLAADPEVRRGLPPVTGGTPRRGWIGPIDVRFPATTA